MCGDVVCVVCSEAGWSVGLHTCSSLVTSQLIGDFPLSSQITTEACGFAFPNVHNDLAIA